MRRPGLWVANGTPSNVGQMLSWKPGSITCFYDYLQHNKVVQYKQENPDVDVIIRFQHPKNWREDVLVSARNTANEIISKWPTIRDMNPYIYYGNEMNLHYENGDEYVGNQHLYETPEFYKLNATWVKAVADIVKQRIPEMRLVLPPFAFGHHEDGAPDNDGNPKDGWAGYDFYADYLKSHFSNIFTFHSYWGNAFGSNRDWLYDPELSSWYAFRWQRVLKLFETRYNINAKVIIDEAGNFNAGDIDFTDQIIYFSQQCLSCAAVLAVTFFLWEDPTYSPGNMPNSWVQRCVDLSGHVHRLANLPEIDISKPENVSYNKTVRIQMKDGSVKTLDLNTYLRGVLPAEMPVTSPAHGGYEDAALDAQAWAAISYTLYRTEHPREAEYDLRYTDQAFNEKAIGSPRADAALERTAGKILVDASGNLFEAQYIKRCGREACPFCAGTAYYTNAKEAPDGIWKDRLCQDGADKLAKQGKTAEEIIEFYYGHLGVTIQDIETKPPIEPPVEPPVNPPVTPPVVPPVEEDDKMFDFEKWAEEMAPRYNDATRFNINIVPTEADGVVYQASVHALTGPENDLNHHIYFMVVDEDGNLDRTKRIGWEWNWEGMKESERPHPGPIILDKQSYEGPPGNLPLIKEWPWVNVWVDGEVSDRVEGIHIRWGREDNEIPGVEWGHRSFFVLFRAVENACPPPVEPPVEPPPVEPPVDPPPVEPPVEPPTDPPTVPGSVEEIYQTALDIRDAIEELLADLEEYVIVPLEDYR